MTDDQENVNETLKSSDVPFRLPSFARIQALNGHMFRVGDEEYEFVNGKYFRRIATLSDGDQFGEEAL